ncbi:alpha-N-arabinofuranosidase [Rahnella victoriana]|uniref:non-reducing end alpha-L-arabinofuranosidase n=1 Tax=Rahnella victoriana TaxID=1510570 RepID=A0ABS0DXF2_9GAMM|nr:alpha-L-arabinofuranosidase C-terminal domain-containing protein [Rahnella victoriana]MBF7957369.1 alpha-N-arabinofuranosidase [Rahnella victoriana]
MTHLKFLFQKENYIDAVDPALYGSFIEHIGRAVYSGIYEPGHKSSDEKGYREDVAKLIKELNISTVRYPGGNFVSGYHWRDGIGPQDQRPVRLDYAWLTKETNQFGIHEFAEWAEKNSITPMIAVNLGTGTPQEAGYFIEYCNVKEGTTLSNLRQQHGRYKPYGFKLWCLGNEMDGAWQTCHLDAEDYVKKARETAKILRWVDRDIKLVACGSSSSLQHTFPEWDRIVLEGLYEQIDYLSCHHYFENRTGNPQDFLASFVQMDNFIHTIVATADYVKAKLRSKKTMMISFDEWNIWSIDGEPWQDYFTDHKRLYEVAPPILEQRYTFLDALVFGGLMCSLINHCDRVKMASLAQLVNVIAPILTQPGGEAIKQTIFWPFQMVSQFGRGVALRYFARVPVIDTVHGASKTIQSAAVFNEETQQIAFFALNTDPEKAFDVTFNLEDFGVTSIERHVALYGEDLDACNTFEQPDNVIPKILPLSDEGRINKQVSLPPLSWNMVVLNVNQ